MQESYRKTSNRALHQVIYFVGVRRFGEAQLLRKLHWGNQDRVLGGLSATLTLGLLQVPWILPVEERARDLGRQTSTA
jgi:hypothetical protein